MKLNVKFMAIVVSIVCLFVAYKYNYITYTPLQEPKASMKTRWVAKETSSTNSHINLLFQERTNSGDFTLKKRIKRLVYAATIHY